MLQQEQRTAESKSLIYHFLFDKAKKNQLRIKLLNMHLRIQFVQRKARQYISAKKRCISKIQKLIAAGASDLRQVILMSSDFKNKYRDAIPYLNNLCYEHHPINIDISHATYIQLIYQHTLHLIRWYAMFRNEGRYSVDAYVTVY